MSIFRMLKLENIHIAFDFSDSSTDMSTFVVYETNGDKTQVVDSNVIKGVNTEKKRDEIMNKFKSKYNLG